MKKYIAFVVVIILIIAGIKAFQLWKSIQSANIGFTEDHKEFFIYTGMDFSMFKDSLKHHQIIADFEAFENVCILKRFDGPPKPGRYVIEQGMSNNQLINTFRSGQQTAENVTFNNVRTLEEFSGKIARYFEDDSLTFLNYFQDPAVASKFGFNEYTFSSMFIPNTYQMWWNTSPEKFSERMASEYKMFWTPDRIEKAKIAGLTQSEVTTLASIVQAETSKTDEAAKIAGVYLNRIDKRMLLQADPTLIFALGDFSIKRVLDVHKEIDSPYNTYKYIGLPPGPINFPSPTYLDAVLEAENHMYYYFCAKPDFSGYHNFSKTYNQHLVYAKKYQQALNKQRIYR